MSPLVVNQNLIYTKNATSALEGKKILRRRSFTSLMVFALVIMFFLVVMVIPIITEYRVYVTVGLDRITDVSAETVKVPFVSTLFPAPSYPTGVYTVKVQVQYLPNPLFLDNVPVGEYTFVLQNITEGLPYTIMVSLLKSGATIDTFAVAVTF
jgi:hypothetical protein